MNLYVCAFCDFWRPEPRERGEVHLNKVQIAYIFLYVLKSYKSSGCYAAEMLSRHLSDVMSRRWPDLAWYLGSHEDDDEDFEPDPKQLDMRTFNTEPGLRPNITVFLRDPSNKQLYWSGFVTFSDSQGNGQPACACCGSALEDGLECRLGEAVLAESLEQELQFAMSSTLHGKRTVIVAEYTGYFGDHMCGHKLMDILRLIGGQYQEQYANYIERMWWANHDHPLQIEMDCANAQNLT